MNRLTDNDKNWGPFTVARWKNIIVMQLQTGPRGGALDVALFGWALRIRLPSAFSCSAEERAYGAILHKIGPTKSMDQLSIYYGQQASSNYCMYYQMGRNPFDKNSLRARWTYCLPWAWLLIRESVCNPDGSRFGNNSWMEGNVRRFVYGHPSCRIMDCLGSRFEVMYFHEGEIGRKIIAWCYIYETEFRKGMGCFKWLGLFWKPIIIRRLDIRFYHIGTDYRETIPAIPASDSIEMSASETSESAFRRYCEKKHRSKHGEYTLTFVGLVTTPAKPINAS